MISATTLCLALSVYFESRNQPITGQHYVAHVVMNRSESTEGKRMKDVCSIVFEESQFSWTNSIKSSKEPVVMVKRAMNRVKDIKSWKRSVEIAHKVANRRSDPTNGARYFNERKMGVRYKTSIKPIIVGKLIYY